jgi:hypothetical protein
LPYVNGVSLKWGGGSYKPEAALKNIQITLPNANMWLAILLAEGLDSLGISKIRIFSKKIAS